MNCCIPSIFITRDVGERFNKKFHTRFNGKGDYVNFYMWPCLFISEEDFRKGSPAFGKGDVYICKEPPNKENNFRKETSPKPGHAHRDQSDDTSQDMFHNPTSKSKVEDTNLSEISYPIPGCTVGLAIQKKPETVQQSTEDVKIHDPKKKGQGKNEPPSSTLVDTETPQMEENPNESNDQLKIDELAHKSNPKNKGYRQQSGIPSHETLCRPTQMETDQPKFATKVVNLPPIYKTIGKKGALPDKIQNPEKMEIDQTFHVNTNKGSVRDNLFYR